MKPYINHMLLLALGIFLFASCSSDDFGLMPGTGKQSGEQIKFEIGFAGESNSATKAATAPDFKTSWEANDAIGLYIVKGDGGLQASGNYVDNMKLTRQTNGTWSYTFPPGKEYYPSATDQLHFYAYYPYDVAMTDPTTYIFNVRADQRVEADYNKSDLLLAKTENVAISKNAVQLQFHHALALVQVEVEREVNISHFTDDFTVTLRGAKPDAALGWSSDLAATGTPTDIVMHKVAGLDYTYRALVPAQALDADSKVTFVQTTSGKEIDMEYQGIKSAPLTAKAARKHRVTLGWGIDPDHTYAVGDVYPHVGPAVGIVYWLDPASGGKHGKVVGLQEKGGVAWSNSLSSTNAINMANGRANMKTIYGLSADFSGYPAFAWVHSLNDANENYSDADAAGVWYLLAKDELSTLYNAYTTYDGSNFNARLTAAGGTAFNDSYFYWSSSELNPSDAWYIYFANSLTYSANKGYNSFSTRCVLVF